MKFPRTNLLRTAAIACAAACLALAAEAPASAAKKIKVVATISAFGQIAREVGGDRVDVTVLDPPTRDVHFYEPKPTDILKLSQADLFAHAGLDLELWRGPLVEAARNRDLFPGAPGEIDCSAGIALLEAPSGLLTRAQGDIHVFGNPHYWLDPANLAIVAGTIAGKLAAADPGNAAAYTQRLAAFQARLEKAIPGWKSRLAPFAGRPLVAYHNSWPYFARAFDLRIDTFLEPKPNIPPSGAHMKEVEQVMRSGKIPAILIEPFQHRAYADQVAERTGARVIVVSQAPGGMPGADDLFAWMDALTAAVAEGLGASSGSKGGAP